MPLAVTADDVEDYLSHIPNPASRVMHRGLLRELYRTARTLGVVDASPIPDRVVGVDYRAKHRLDDQVVRNLIGFLTRECATRSRALRARRDLVLVALACLIECTAESLRVLTWGDLGVVGDKSVLRIQIRGGTKEVVLPAPVTDRVDHLRAELLRWGVVVDLRDALLPPLGHRIEWSWTLADRAILEPLQGKSLNHALSVTTRRASCDASLEGNYFNHHWLLRDPARIDEVLGGPRPATRLEMRRPRIDYAA